MREPHLLRVEASKTWDAPPPAALPPAAAAAHPPPAVGFHLLRVEQPTSQLRIDGKEVRPRGPGGRR